MSRLAVLISIILLVVAVSALDVTILPMYWFGDALPYILVALVLFVVARNGCCGSRCRSKSDAADEPSTV